MQPKSEASLHVAEVTRDRGRLLRVLGAGFGLAVIVGNTISAGILRTPGEVAAQLPNAWLFIGVWIAGGLYALLGAISLAELGAMLPRAGGQYVFARYALGEYAGFIVGWSDWLSMCGTTAAVSIVIGEYTGVLVPALAGRSVTIAIAVSVIFAALQWRGVLWGSSIQNVTTALKALGFIALVVACFALGGSDATSMTTTIATPATTPTGWVFLFALVLALQSVIYTYDGWNGMLYFSEEVREPGRDIPRAMFSGVLSIIAIYLLVNLALLYVLPISKIAGNNFALGSAAQIVFGAHGDTIIRSLTILSMLSGLNAYHLAATRTLYAMSRDDLFSRRATKVNAGGTPTAALFVSATVAVLFILGGKTFETVITILAFFFVANYTISFIAVFILRQREPEKERPYLAWGYPWTTALSLIFSIAFLAGAIRADTRNSVYALLLLAASYPVFIIFRRLAN
jgi:APA family basic amino acid/polyamine antiporter